MFLGIDPGLRGAVTVFGDDGAYLNHFRMPVTRLSGSPTVKNKINPKYLKAELDRYFIPSENNNLEKTPIAYLEYPNVMPGPGLLAKTSLRHSIGVIESVFELMGATVVYVDPRKWKKYYNLIKKHKHQAIIIALEQVPEMGKILKKDIDVAESILIGLYGHRCLNPSTK